MKKVVIIGGGFAGSCAAKILESKFETYLIDTKEYFEFTPAILRTIVQPLNLENIQLKHSDYLINTKVIIGNALKLEKNSLIVKSKFNKKRIDFDYLIITSGSNYSAPIKSQKLAIASRSNDLFNYSKKLDYSNDVLIIGGGLVGVELAGEIIDKYPKKNITIVTGGENLIERQNKVSQEYVKKYLEEKNVKIIFKEYVNYKNGKFILENSKKEIKCDIAFYCTGITPNNNFLKKYFKESLDNKGRIKVDKYLKVEKYSNIFAAGDIIHTNEEKLAQSAEDQGKIAALNIINIESKNKLLEYAIKKRPIAISLGKYNGAIVHNDFTLKGKLPAIGKWAIEKIFMFKLKYI